MVYPDGLVGYHSPHVNTLDRGAKLVHFEDVDVTLDSGAHIQGVRFVWEGADDNNCKSLSINLKFRRLPALTWSTAGIFACPVDGQDGLDYRVYLQTNDFVVGNCIRLDGMIPHDNELEPDAWQYN